MYLGSKTRRAVSKVFLNKESPTVLKMTLLFPVFDPLCINIRKSESICT